MPGAYRAKLADERDVVSARGFLLSVRVVANAINDSAIAVSDGGSDERRPLPSSRKLFVAHEIDPFVGGSVDKPETTKRPEVAVMKLATQLVPAERESFEHRSAVLFERGRDLGSGLAICS